jgi:hypothetical protein
MAACGVHVEVDSPELGAMTNAFTDAIRIELPIREAAETLAALDP